MEYGLNNDNDRVDGDISLSDEDFYDYGEGDEHIRLGPKRAMVLMERHVT